GIMMFLFVDSMLQGGERDSERNLIWYETSSARIYHRENVDEWKRANLKNLIENPDQILNNLRSAGLKATARSVFNGEMIVYKDPFPEDGSLQVRVTAIDPLTDSTVYRFQNDLTENSTWLEPGTNQIIMGGWMAEDIGADIGYSVTIVTRTYDGAYQTFDLEIVGLANTGNPIVNRGAILMDQGYADEFLMLNGAVTQIDLSFPITAEADEAVAVIQEALPPNRNDVDVLSWQDLAADYLLLAASKQSGSAVILGILFIIALVGISNTMLLAMYERRRELGMMRALGMKNSEIMLSFLLEAGGIGIIGGAIGLALGAGVVAFLVEIGINYEFLLRDFDAGYRISSVFRGVWRPEMFVLSLIAATLMAMVSALIPTRHAMKMNITECLSSDT
ncbi:MAG: ABC transporter permease, partial [Salinispira sp.]